MPNVRRHLSSNLGFVNTSTSAEKKCLRLRFFSKSAPGAPKEYQFKFMTNKVWRSDWYVHNAFTTTEVKDREGYKLLLGIIETGGPIEPLIDWMVDHFPQYAGDIMKYVEAANAKG